MKNLFTRVSASAALVGTLIATDAPAAQRGPKIIEGSLQNNGDICYDMPKIRFDAQRAVQPDGTLRLCTDKDGNLTTRIPPNVNLDAYTVCLPPNKPSPVRCP